MAIPVLAAPPKNPLNVEKRQESCCCSSATVFGPGVITPRSRGFDAGKRAAVDLLPLFTTRLSGLGGGFCCGLVQSFLLFSSASNGLAAQVGLIKPNLGGYKSPACSLISLRGDFYFLRYLVEHASCLLAITVVGVLDFSIFSTFFW